MLIWRVERLVLAIVLDLGGDAVGAIAAGDFEPAGASGADRRAIGNAEVDAGVHLRIAEQRMAAHAEARGELGARNRRAQQRLGGAAAALIIIVGLSVGGGEAVERLLLAAEGELRIVQNLALGGRAGERVAVEDFEAVGRFHLALEVDVIGEDAGQLGGDVVGNLLSLAVA